MLSRWSLVLLAVIVAASLRSPAAVGEEFDWRRAAAHAKTNSAMLVFVTAKVDGTVVRESAYCGSTITAPNELLSAYHCVDSIARLEGTWAYLEDGRKFKVTGIAAQSVGWDQVLLTAPGVRPAGVVEISDDIATGDEVMGVGAPNGEKFKASWGRIDRIYMGLHEACDGTRRPDPIGHKEHQVVEVDRVSFFGWSGGGVWNRDGKLVGVHVRGYYWEPYPGYNCSEPYRGEYQVFGAMVGGKTVKEFLAGGGR